MPPADGDDSSRGSSRGKWVLPVGAIENGGINGWPGLNTDFEVLSVTGKVRSMLSQTTYIKRFWTKGTTKLGKHQLSSSSSKASVGVGSKSNGRGFARKADGHAAEGRKESGEKSRARGRPTYPPKMPYVRATVAGPAWTRRGWTPQEPGFVYWATMWSEHDLADQEGASADAAHARRRSAPKRTECGKFSSARELLVLWKMGRSSRTAEA